MIENIKLENKNSFYKNRNNISNIDFKSILKNSNEQNKKSIDIKNQLIQSINKNKNIKKNKKELDQKDFIKLITTQIKNQDPFSPKDNADITAKLSNFSTIKHMENINDKLENIKNSIDKNIKLNYINYIGLNISTDKSKVLIEDNKIINNINFNLNKNTKEIKVNLYDGDKIIYSKDISDFKKGKNKLNYLISDLQNMKIKNGVYDIQILAKDMQNKKSSVKITNKLMIEGVDFKDDNIFFNTSIGDLKKEEINSITL